MSSAEKTQYLGLNKWKGSDVPQMSDFVLDNVLVDSALGSHKNDRSIHISPDERKTWNSPYFVGRYMGDGSSQRNITLESDFVPSFGIMFAVGIPPLIGDYQNKANYNYFAVFSKEGSSFGVSLEGKTLTVSESSVASIGTGYKRFNENGVSYIYIVFR